ncbi:MAG: FHA domain-containing protein [Deltaproteobacteria bacterium]|nr:FHA domain-containing protein [Deltaproteobacteria bacterium]
MPSLTVRLRDRQVAHAQIVKAETRIGRDPLCDVAIDNAAVSRVHAALRIEGNDAVIVDCDSANGILVNGVATKWQVLKDGDVIQIAKFHITYAASGAPSIAELARMKPAEPAASPDTINPDGTVHMSSGEIQKLMRSYDPEIGGIAAPLKRPASTAARAPASQTAIMQTPVSKERRLIIAMSIAILVLIVIVVALALKKP